jgi:hypothetical protein
MRGLAQSRLPEKAERRDAETLRKAIGFENIRKGLASALICGQMQLPFPLQ